MSRVARGDRVNLVSDVEVLPLRYWASRSNFLSTLLICLVLLPLAPGSAAASLSTARQQYGDAMEAIDRGRWTEYEELRPSLDDYPLAIYLDYSQLSRRPSQVRPADARRFINLSNDSPLPNRFLSLYLKQAGRERRWQDFLAVKPDEPNSVDLKCYYFRAKLAQGDQLAAWEGAERLWVYGKSRPKACDPLFSAWLKADQLSDEVVWARLLKAFEARQRSLMRYVAKKSSPALKPWSEKLLAVYAQPEKMRRQSLPAEEAYSADIATHGLVYLARYNPQRALDYWESYRQELVFSAAQGRAVESAIALQSLFARTDAHRVWLQSALARLEDDKLVELRLRWALAEQDWASLEQALPLLSEEKVSEGVWRYWRAMLLERQGDSEAAVAILDDLAGERDYYSFLAAEKRGRPYAFNNQPIALKSTVTEPLRSLPAVQRVGELHFHEEQNLAHSEWFKILQDTDDAESHQQLALLAADEGWHRMAIDAANRAKAWDALDLRFPMPYQETFNRHASSRQLPSTELMAIARRESAFFAQARSPVGARGLMQIMPATGKQVASSIGRRHSTSDLYEVEHNVLLGSTYYRQLLDRFNGNRVFALTAYNAGPHRVERWRNKAGEEVPVEIWIETIPYRETRNYVKAVLSYNVVFQHMMGDTPRLLTSGERHANY